MGNINSQINKILREERVKKYRYIAILLSIFFVLILLTTSINISVQSEMIKGELVYFGAIPSETGNRYYIRVKLKSGDIVRVSYPNMLSPKIGTKIRLLEAKNIWGFKIYKYVTYE